jgi:hypothetical protein
MSIGVQRTTTKHNQQFNELLVAHARINNVEGFFNNDLNIKSSEGKNIVLNESIKITNQGNLVMKGYLELEGMKLSNQMGNLIWGSDVIITDSSLQSEIDNVIFNKIDLQALNEDTGFLNKNKIQIKSSLELEASYNLILPKTIPRKNHVLGVSESSNFELAWIPIPIPNDKVKLPIGAVIKYQGDIKSLPNGWKLYNEKNEKNEKNDKTNELYDIIYIGE